MSFNFNSVGSEFNQPTIKQSSKVGDGSGGNTGYFQQEQQEDDEQNQHNRDEFDKSIFNEDDDDSFLEESDDALAKKIFEKFKNFLAINNIKK